MNTKHCTWDTRPSPGTLVRFTNLVFAYDINSARVFSVGVKEKALVIDYDSSAMAKCVILLLSCGTSVKVFCGNDAAPPLYFEPV